MTCKKETKKTKQEVSYRKLLPACRYMLRACASVCSFSCNKSWPFAQRIHIVVYSCWKVKHFVHHPNKILWQLKHTHNSDIKRSKRASVWWIILQRKTQSCFEYVHNMIYDPIQWNTVIFCWTHNMNYLMFCLKGNTPQWCGWWETMTITK